MRGVQAKRLRAAAKIYQARVAVPVLRPETRISKKHPPTMVRLPSGQVVPMPRPDSQIIWWPAGSLRRAYQNIKRAWTRGRYTIHAGS